MTRRVGDLAATQMVLLLVLLPFAAYILGEKIGVSGILAAVAAGMTTNFADLGRGNFIAERMQTEGIWSIMEAAFNGAIFLMLGLQLPSIIGTTLVDAGPDWWKLVLYVVAITLGLLAVRWVWVSLCVVHSLRKAHQGDRADKPSLLLNLATTMAGIRGAVTLAGALSIPVLLPGGQAFPARHLLIFLATGVILLTLILGAIALPLILRRIPKQTDSENQREERAARLVACKAAIASLALNEEDTATRDEAWVARHQEVVGRIVKEYRNRIELLEGSLNPDNMVENDDAMEDRRERYNREMELRLQCLKVERDTLYAERQAHRINDEVLRAAVSELDLAEVSLTKRLNVSQRDAAAYRAARR